MFEFSTHFFFSIQPQELRICEEKIQTKINEIWRDLWTYQISWRYNDCKIQRTWKQSNWLWPQIRRIFSTKGDWTNSNVDFIKQDSKKKCHYSTFWRLMMLLTIQVEGFALTMCCDIATVNIVKLLTDLQCFYFLHILLY